jgi:peptidyl-prolyl cis-trans isomerase C
MMRTAWRFAAIGGVVWVLRAMVDPLDPVLSLRERRGLDDESLLARAAAALDLQRDDAVVARRLIRDARFLEAMADDAAALDAATGLGFAASDLVVQRRLASRLRMAIEAAARAAEPGDAELRAYVAAHADRFAVPARAQVTQVFLSRARRGAALDADARRARRHLHAGMAVDGDPLPLPAALPPLSAAELAALLGGEVADAAFRLPLGEWGAPVASPFGLHVLRVESRRPARLPALGEVRAAAREAVLAERADAAVAAALRALRAGG